MDRALVCTTETLIVGDKTYVIMPNLSFEFVQPDLIRLIPELNPALYATYYKWMNQSYWNIAFVNDAGDIRAFIWGFFCPVEQLVAVLRLVIKPEDRDILFTQGICDEVLKFGERIGARRVILISDRIKAWAKILKNKVEISKAGVVERVLW